MILNYWHEATYCRTLVKTLEENRLSVEQEMIALNLDSANTKGLAVAIHAAAVRHRARV
jgi:hypothetical protein